MHGALLPEVSLWAASLKRGGGLGMARHTVQGMPKRFPENQIAIVTGDAPLE